MIYAKNYVSVTWKYSYVGRKQPFTGFKNDLIWQITVDFGLTQHATKSGIQTRPCIFTQNMSKALQYIFLTFNFWSGNTTFPFNTQIILYVSLSSSRGVNGASLSRTLGGSILGPDKFLSFSGECQFSVEWIWRSLWNCRFKMHFSFTIRVVQLKQGLVIVFFLDLFIFLKYHVY